MLRTVIIIPYQKNVSGTVEQRFENNCAYIKLNLNCESDSSHIIRLYALSTAHAAVSPYLAKSFGGETAIFPETVITESDLLNVGYKPREIDTYVITKCSDNEETPLGAAFFGLEWSAARFLNPSYKNAERNKNSPTPDSPLTNAKQLLEKRKQTKDRSDFYIAEFIKNAVVNPKAEIKGEYNYNWYRIAQNKVVSSLSGVRHAISNKMAVVAINDWGYYLAGINKKDSRHIAIAIPSNRNICPMPQLSDCTIYKDGYHIVGLFLGTDGQYFEKYLQNQEQ